MENAICCCAGDLACAVGEGKLSVSVCRGSWMAWARAAGGFVATADLERDGPELQVANCGCAGDLARAVGDGMAWARAAGGSVATVGLERGGREVHVANCGCARGLVVGVARLSECVCGGRD